MSIVRHMGRKGIRTTSENEEGKKREDEPPLSCCASTRSLSSSRCPNNSIESLSFTASCMMSAATAALFLRNPFFFFGLPGADALLGDSCAMQKPIAVEKHSSHASREKSHLNPWQSDRPYSKLILSTRNTNKRKSFVQLSGAKKQRNEKKERFKESDKRQTDNLKTNVHVVHVGNALLVLRLELHVVVPVLAVPPLVRQVSKTSTQRRA